MNYEGRGGSRALRILLQAELSETTEQGGQQPSDPPDATAPRYAARRGDSLARR
jgi:hypothetical protein